MKKTLILIAALLSGCTNPYAKFYQGMPDARVRPGYVPSSEPVKIYSSNDIQQDARSLMVKGYLPVGESSFNAASNQASQSQLIFHANKIGAQLVLVKSAFSHTVSGALPLTVPNTATSYSSGTATAYGPGGSVTAYGSGTTTTYGSQTTMVPYTIQRYDFDAMYFVKAKPRVGFIAVAIDNETRRKLGTNSGVRVDIVIENSGAFENDVLPGDIVLKFNDTKIQSVEHYSEMLSTYSGQSVTLTINRDGVEILKVLPFARL
ncbi:MAG: PDZ domain-containing protein [Pseudomonadota bacterium]